MTRQEYKQKTADGTLTVADVLRNTEYATPKQLEIFTGFGRALSKRMRVEQDTTRLISELAALSMQFLADLDNTTVVDQWGFASGDTDETNPETSELVRVTRERCKEIAKRVADLIDESGEQSEV